MFSNCNNFLLYFTPTKSLNYQHFITYKFEAHIMKIIKKRTSHRDPILTFVCIFKTCVLWTCVWGEEESCKVWSEPRRSTPRDVSLKPVGDSLYAHLVNFNIDAYAIRLCVCCKHYTSVTFLLQLVWCFIYLPNI